MFFTQKQKEDDRFDYNKDPVAWFYQVGPWQQEQQQQQLGMQLRP
jgi:hypothetical protein